MQLISYASYGKLMVYGDALTVIGTQKLCRSYAEVNRSYVKCSPSVRVTVCTIIHSH